METWEREYHVSRIIAGQNRCSVSGQVYKIITPSREARYVANEIYQNALEEAHLLGVLTDPEILYILQMKGLWTDHDEDQYGKLNKIVEDFKVGLFERWTESNARFAIRHALHKARSELERLDGIRHGLDHMTCNGVAMSAKARYTVGCSLLLPNGQPYWEDPTEDWNKPDDMVDIATEHLMRNRLREHDFRELSRTDPWNNIWNTKEHSGGGLFGAPSVDLSEEQRGLILWSGIYDSIREHPDCPGSGIMEDDDMLDGWMIIQRRKREAMQAQKRGSEISNEKIRNANEVYIMSDTVEDARQVDKLNDQVASHIKQQRMAHLKKHGTVSEMNMPDTWQRFQMELAQLESNRIRGR